jgi:hypothetical protein
MIENTDMVSIHGQTVDNTQAYGKMESNMEKEHIDSLAARKEEDTGKKVRGLNG